MERVGKGEIAACEKVNLNKEGKKKLNTYCIKIKS